METGAEARLERIRPILEEFKHELWRIYGPRLKRLILYGSYARGEAEEGPDLDLMVVLDRADDPLAERERLPDLIFRLALKHNVVLSVLPIAERDLERPKPLLLNVKREGIPV